MMPGEVSPVSLLPLSNIHALFINIINHQHFLLMDKESCCLMLLHLPSAKHVVWNNTLSCWLVIFIFFLYFLSSLGNIFIYNMGCTLFSFFVSWFICYFLVYLFVLSVFLSEQELWLKYDKLSKSVKIY